MISAESCGSEADCQAILDRADDENDIDFPDPVAGDFSILDDSTSWFSSNDMCMDLNVTQNEINENADGVELLKKSWVLDEAKIDPESDPDFTRCLDSDIDAQTSNKPCSEITAIQGKKVK